MKKIFKIVITSLLVVILTTGCQTKIGVGIKIGQDKSVKLESSMLMDNEAIDSAIDTINAMQTGNSEPQKHTNKERWAFLESDEAMSAFDDLDGNYTVKKYDKDGFKGYIYTINLGSIDKAISNKSNSELNDYGVVFTKKDDVYTIKLSSQDAVNSEELGAYQDYVKYTFKIELPNKAISNNATKVSENTYTWDLTKVKEVKISFKLTTSYKVTYNLDNGINCSTNPKTIKENNKKIVLCEPTKKGYVFKGWYSDKEKTKQVTEIKKNTNKKVTLYAKWEPIKYKVKFDSNTGKGNEVTIKCTYDKKCKLKKNSYTKSGYTFNGWNTKKDGSGKTYKDQSEVKNLTTKKSITLYAQWKVNKYTIKFDGNGATSGETKKIKVKYGKKVILTKNEFKKKGYKFTGWNTKKDGSGKTYKNQSEVKNLTKKSSITLYAQWKKK